MKEKLISVREKVKADVALIKTAVELENIRVKYLGKKGELTAILRQMGQLSDEDRPIIGKIANEVRQGIERELEEKKELLSSLLIEQKLKTEQIDVTMPGRPHSIGKKHPLTLVLDELYDIFLGMGFSIVTGPEVEFDYYNFDALNSPKDHQIGRASCRERV